MPPKYKVDGNLFTSEQQLREAMIDSNDFRLVAYANEPKNEPVKLIEALNAFGHDAEIVE